MFTRYVCVVGLKNAVYTAKPDHKNSEKIGNCMKSGAWIASAMGLCLAGGLATQAYALNYDLLSSAATIVSGNITSSFLDVGVNNSGNVNSITGSGSSLYTATAGGDGSTGFWVTINFNGHPQPVLTSAFLKAGDFYLDWDSTALSAFNAGTYTSITLWNSGSGGIMNPPGNAYLGTSHVGLNGTPGTSVPDGGTTVLLLGAALSGLGVLNRRWKK